MADVTGRAHLQPAIDAWQTLKTELAAWQVELPDQNRWERVRLKSLPLLALAYQLEIDILPLRAVVAGAAFSYLGEACVALSALGGKLVAKLAALESVGAELEKIDAALTGATVCQKTPQGKKIARGRRPRYPKVVDHAITLQDKDPDLSPLGIFRDCTKRFEGIEPLPPNADALMKAAIRERKRRSHKVQ
jgi:hypothetical protein